MHQLRRVGELEEEDLLGRDRADARRVAAAREDVEGVQADAERRVVGRLDDPPRVVVVAARGGPTRAPRRRSRSPRAGGALGQLVQLRGGEGVVVDRVPARRWSRPAPCRRRAPPSRRTSPRRGAGCARASRRAPPRSRGTAGRARSAGPSASARARAPRRARAGEAIRSGSNSSTASKPGAGGGRELLLERPAQADRRDALSTRLLRGAARRSGRASGRGRAARRRTARASARGLQRDHARRRRACGIRARARRCSSGVRAGGRRPPRPTAPGRSSSGGRPRCRGATSMPVGVAWMSPSAPASSRARSSAAGRARARGRAPSRAPRRVDRSSSTTCRTPAPELEDRVGRPPPRPRRRPEHDLARPRARQAPLERPRRSRSRRCCGRPVRPSSKTTVFTAPMAAASARQLVEVLDDELLAGCVTLTPRRPSRAPRASSAPTSARGGSSSSRS